MSRVDQVSIRIAKFQLPLVAQLLKRQQLAELHKIAARYKHARMLKLVGRVDGTWVPEVGTLLQVELAAKYLHFFDSETGSRVR